MSDLRTNLSKVKALGSSKYGVMHWWHQRLSAIMLVILTIWVLFIIKSNIYSELSVVIHNIQKPCNIIAIGLFVLVGLYHSMLGMQVIMEDYIHCNIIRISLLIILKIVVLLTIFTFIIALISLMNT